MKGLSKRILSGVALGIALIVVVLRRRSSTINSAPILPPPPPSEPPRIVLPTSVIESAEPVPNAEVIESHDAVPETVEGAEAPVEQVVTSEAEAVAAAIEDEQEIELHDVAPATVEAPEVSVEQVEASEVETAVASANEQETDAPLLERAVGESESTDTSATLHVPAIEEQIEAPPDDDADLTIGYCVSCRTKRPMIDAHEEITENGRRALRGTCPECGNTIFRFLPNAD